MKKLPGPLLSPYSEEWAGVVMREGRSQIPRPVSIGYNSRLTLCPVDLFPLDFTDRSTIVDDMIAETDTRQRILQSARDLFYANSYFDVGVAAICEAAGVKKGSFYHFFPSKLDLTLAVIDEFLLEYRQQIYERAFDRGIPPLERLARVVDLTYQYQKKLREDTGHTLGCPFGNLASELSTTEELIRNKVAGIFRSMEQSFLAALQEAASQGDLAGVDLDATAKAMAAYIEGVMLMAKAQNDPEVIRSIGSAVVDLRIMNGA